MAFPGLAGSSSVVVPKHIFLLYLSSVDMTFPGLAGGCSVVVPEHISIPDSVRSIIFICVCVSMSYKEPGEEISAHSGTVDAHVESETYDIQVLELRDAHNSIVNILQYSLP